MLAGRDDDAPFLNPPLEPLRPDGLRNRQRPESTASGIRIEPCVDAVQERTIGLRVLPRPRVEGTNGFTPTQIFFKQG